ncbi:redox-sensitive transcriptional activator SoxR [Curtobacterium flaccumfaciens]|uniref:redox-sensitive transcriptional activator SoxR n=1 Tax=Curtobacterium flaccumfaciens TaxID=2035 RepID=UPI001BE06608|nr:redox-sensitive transcriptional activator SoxR [Curtobacterium flaccumfaciens]MBT1584587.1 redox-sensitive transcriptional activator SoxR [Curtobacterium flaccumfaciens pv. flaccumfaciens]MCX2798278.1 redox-sensitive transcriptional activator SoxR [Curtobacterium flaccumfaciens pv. flaccumfaciens]
MVEIQAPRPTDLLPIGEIVRRTGVAASALHFYERKGLIHPERTDGGTRMYPRHVERRIAIIQVAKRLGIPLSEVAEQFEALPADRMPSLRDWNRLNERWRARLRARQLELERLQQEMTQCIGCGCVSLGACSVVNPGDALGDEGHGARRLLPIQDEAADDAAATTDDDAAAAADATEDAVA